MATSLVVLVLIAALLHAGWNVIVKSGEDGLVTLFLIKLPTIVISVGVLTLTGLPETASFPYIIGSTVSFLLYSYLLTAAYHAGDLSLVYPIARGTAPILIAVVAAIAIAEIPEPAVIAGIAIVSTGVLCLVFGTQHDSTSTPAVLYAVGVGISITGYSISDGIGVRISGNPLGYIAALHLVSGVTLSVAISVIRGRRAWQIAIREWRRGLIGGAMMFAAYAIVIYAMIDAPLAAVTALRETSVVFAALIGAVILKEPFGIKRTIAAFFVVTGIVVLTLSGG